MNRTLGIFAIGLVVGFGVASLRSRTHGASASTIAKSEEIPARNAASTEQKREEMNRVILGNITTVPFQELYSVLASRTSEELAQAAQQLKELPAGRETNRKIGAFFKVWAHLDSRAAYASATAFKGIEEKGAAISAVVEGADPAAAEFIARAIDELSGNDLPPDRKRGLLGRAATKWSEVDPPAAIKFLEASPLGAGKYFADWHTMAANWGASDPPAALAWAQQRDGGGQPTHFATSGAISGWWQKDARSAEAYVASHLDTLSDWQLASTLASQMYNADPQHAIDWVNQLPNVEAR